MLCHVSDAARRHAHYTKTSWAVESVRRLNYTPCSNYHYPFKHVKCVLLRCHCFVRSTRGMRGCSVFRQFVFFFSSAFSNLIGNTMDFVVNEQPVRTLCMHCFFQLLQWDTCHAWRKCVFEHRNCHVARICANARWKMTHAMPQHETRAALGGVLWWRRCQQMNDSFRFFLVKGQNNEHEWREWNGEGRETCVMSAINLNLPFTRRVCVSVLFPLRFHSCP